MPYCTLVQLAFTCSAGGAATVYSSGSVFGEIRNIRYVPGSPTPSNSFTYVLTGEQSGLAVDSETVATGNAALERYPRAATQGQTGTASLYAAAGTAVQDRVAMAGERLKLVIASAGNATQGTFYVVVDGTVQ